jgi:hypothetical protein
LWRKIMPGTRRRNSASPQLTAQVGEDLRTVQPGFGIDALKQVKAVQQKCPLPRRLGRESSGRVGL